MFIKHRLGAPSASPHKAPLVIRPLMTLVLLLILSACQPEQLEDALTAPVQTAIPPKATPTVTPTPLVTGGGEARPHYFIVSYANEIAADDVASGDKRISVVATIGTSAETGITVGLDSLVLVDDGGATYVANPPEGTTQPALPGFELATDESIYGFVTFDMPAEATPVRLLWCAEDAHPCAAPFDSEIP
ncbi:hypothetical protein GC175_30600 [bacterium]|nr:hypothetical protein [bacterium]